MTGYVVIAWVWIAGALLGLLSWAIGTLLGGPLQRRRDGRRRQ